MKDRIVCLRGKRLGSVRQGKRLGVLRAKAKHETEVVQQQAAARMLRDLVKQHVRALEGVPGFATDPKQMERGHAAQGHQVDLQRVAFGTLVREIEQAHRDLGEIHALAGAEMQQCRLGRLGGVAQCAHRLASSLEMHRQFGRGHRQACGALRSSAAPTLRCSCPRTAVAMRSYSTWRKSACLKK